MTERVIIVGGPRCGKSTLARKMLLQGVPVYCGDPKSKVKEPEIGVVYLPEEFAGSDSWSAGSQYVCDHWFSIPGPWVMEGQIMARALRKWVRSNPGRMPADQILVFMKQHRRAVITKGQRAMHRGVVSVWAEIAHNFRGIYHPAEAVA